jgi:hypothetical protein
MQVSTAARAGVLALLGSAFQPLCRAEATADPLQLSGSVRARYEALSGQPRASVKEADQWLSLRTLVDLSYDAGPVRFFGELQDSRVYLADAGSAISSNDVNAAELVQAYVAATFKDVAGAGSRLDGQLGRFTLNLGSRRLVAADDYRNTTNGVTGAKLDFKWRSGTTVTAFYTLPQTRLPDALGSVLDNGIRWDRESSAVELYGASLLAPQRLAGGSLETLWLRYQERDAPGRPTKDRNLTTWDLRWFRDPAAGHWDWEVEAALQDGRASTGTSASAPVKDVAANFVHLRLGYQWAGGWKPRLGLDVDRASGEDNGLKSHRFDTLLGMRRSDFAPSGLYNLVGRANILSPGIRLEATPAPRLDVLATARALYLASSRDAFSTIGIRDARGLSGDHAGTQFDARVRYWLVPRKLRLDVGGILLAKGRFLREAPGTRQDGNVTFLNIAVQANF